MHPCAVRVTGSLDPPKHGQRQLVGRHVGTGCKPLAGRTRIDVG